MRPFCMMRSLVSLSAVLGDALLVHALDARARVSARAVLGDRRCRRDVHSDARPVSGIVFRTRGNIDDFDVHALMLRPASALMLSVPLPVVVQPASVLHLSSVTVLVPGDAQLICALAVQARVGVGALSVDALDVRARVCAPTALDDGHEICAAIRPNALCNSSSKCCSLLMSRGCAGDVKPRHVFAQALREASSMMSCRCVKSAVTGTRDVLHDSYSTHMGRDE